jgi:hypothetical protein
MGKGLQRSGGHQELRDAGELEPGKRFGQPIVGAGGHGRLHRHDGPGRNERLELFNRRPQLRQVIALTRAARRRHAQEDDLALRKVFRSADLKVSVVTANGHLGLGEGLRDGSAHHPQSDDAY